MLKCIDCSFFSQGIQVGMGPTGELRYPSCPSQKLTWAWRSRELGEFQCYDKVGRKFSFNYKLVLKSLAVTGGRCRDNQFVMQYFFGKLNFKPIF
jgi:hypothetical protein